MKERISKYYELISKREFTILPGNLAYSFFLSLIPILSLLFYLLTTFKLPMSLLQDFLNTTFPKSVVDIIQPVFNNEMPINQFLTLCFSIIVITGGCNSIIIASNTVFNVENGGFIKRMIKSLFLAVVLIILIAFMLIVPLFGQSIIKLFSILFSAVANNIDKINKLYSILRIPVSLLVMFGIIKLVYIIAPDERIRGRYANKGALFTTLSWLIVTIVYSYYINNIARYDLVYGNLANIVILLFWLYILAYIFVLGLCMNRIKSEESIEKTNRIKLDEIRKRVIEEQKKE